MPSVNFSGATIGVFKGTHENGSVKRLIHVKTNPPTKAVREAMDWQEMPGLRSQKKAARASCGIAPH